MENVTLEQLKGLSDRLGIEVILKIKPAEKFEDVRPDNTIGFNTEDKVESKEEVKPEKVSCETKKEVKPKKALEVVETVQKELDEAGFVEFGSPEHKEMIESKVEEVAETIIESVDETPEELEDLDVEISEVIGESTEDVEEDLDDDLADLVNGLDF